MALHLPNGSSKRCVSVSAIDAGRITAPKWVFIETDDNEAKLSLPCLAFLITRDKEATALDAPMGMEIEAKRPTRIMFDLGLREDHKNYTEAQQAHIKNRQPVTFGPNVSVTLEKGGISSADIDWVIYSHVHWDHTGEPSQYPNATFVMGYGSQALLEQEEDPTAGSHAAFDKKLLGGRNVIELPPTRDLASQPSCTNGILTKDKEGNYQIPWTPLGPFPATIDIFGDSSVLVIPSPGHLQGHINLLCRVAEKRWVYLGGDTYHDRTLLTGEGRIATWKDEMDQILCVHTDRMAAEEMFMLIRQFQSQAAADGIEVELISSHDQFWYNENLDRFFPNTL